VFEVLIIFWDIVAAPGCTGFAGGAAVVWCEGGVQPVM